MTVIETERLRLRPFTTDDAPAYYHAILSDERVMEFMPGGKPLPEARALSYVRGLVDHWQDEGYGLWAVEHLATGDLIGHCGLQQVDYAPVPELAFALARAYWRKGMAQEAGKAVLRYGFEALQLPRIVAVFVPENKAARAVVERIGMKFERYAWVNGARIPFYAIEQGVYLPDESAAYRVLP